MYVVEQYPLPGHRSGSETGGARESSAREKQRSPPPFPKRHALRSRQEGRAGARSAHPVRGPCIAQTGARPAGPTPSRADVCPQSETGGRGRKLCCCNVWCTDAPFGGYCSPPRAGKKLELRGGEAWGRGGEAVRPSQCASGGRPSVLGETRLLSPCRPCPCARLCHCALASLFHVAFP